MQTERKKCPYCDEDIALSAKKCRFCGEWLPEAEEMQMSQPVPQEPPVESENIIPPVQPTGTASQLEIIVSENTYSFSPTLINFICVLGIGAPVIWLLSLLADKYVDLSTLQSFSNYIWGAAFIATYFMIAYKLRKDNMVNRAQGIFGLAGIMAFSFLVELFGNDESEFAEVLSTVGYLAEIVIAIVLISITNTRKIGLWSLATIVCLLIFGYWVFPEVISGYGSGGISKLITILVFFPIYKFYESCKKYLCNLQSEEGLSPGEL